MEGYIHSVQTMGTVDGPGVRFVLFMQGCPLRCGCCHNPDTWGMGGTARSSQDVIKQVLRYRPYFGEDGGITVSGGEALLQEEFVEELFSLCKAEGIHTCLDTSGFRITKSTKKLLSVTDLVLLDIKYTNDGDYSKYVGCALKSVLEFLNLLEDTKTDTWLRQVIIPTKNDNVENLRLLSDITKTHSCVKKTELLAFRKLCLEKYEELGIHFPFKHMDEASPELMDKMNKCLSDLLKTK